MPDSSHDDGTTPRCLCEEMAGGTIKLAPTCIGSLWLFEQLSLAEIKALTVHTERRIYKGGEHIFHQGDPANRLFFIKGGRIKLSKVTEDGNEITLDIRKDGDCLGENMLNEEEDFPVTATCIEPTLICGLSKERFEELVLAYPAIGLQVIKNLSRRIDWLTSQVGSMSHSHLEERLYRVLVNVAREHGQREPRGFLLNIPVTHEDLSFLVGAHRVSLTRAMKRLKETGRVVQQGRSLIVSTEVAM